ncbi:SPFH domain-containing protein [Sandaracinus amylolyticus]|uniref:SPFH domain-containing protein n=1 Tax=Sandaracinus amylolyticus TaxID=927083 RepID=UPI001F1626EB|nr:SPFH domain-containing protein [Sandaracinus amylolyticus]
MDFVRGGVREMMIARPDSAKDLIVYKHPERTIPKFSQLTIDADEAAVFFRDGSLVGVLRTAGVGQRHQLDTGNIPFLSNLVDSFTGGNIFVTDLYFVSMRPNRNTKFGGPFPPMKDPELEITVSPRIFGTFIWRVVEPDKFIVNYVGMGGTPSNDRVESFIQTKFMNSVKKTVPNFVIRQKIEIQALPAYHDELGQSFLQKCDDLSEIGAQFLGLGDFTINFSDDELKRIQDAQDRYADIKAKKRAKDELTGGNFMQYAAGEAMLGAGQGMAKGGEGTGMVGAGAGLGMGFAMANMYGQQMGQPGQPQQGGYPQQPPPAQAAQGATVTCPGCSAKVPPGKFCAECGTSLAPPQPKPCPACQTMLAPGTKFCPNCGTRAT